MRAILALVCLCALFVVGSSNPNPGNQARIEVTTSNGARGQRWHFNLLAANNQVVLSSQSYKSLDAAVDGAVSVLVNGNNKAQFESKTSKNKKPYFVLKAQNNQVIGNSQMYSSGGARNAGIGAVQRAVGKITARIAAGVAVSEGSTAAADKPAAVLKSAGQFTFVLSHGGKEVARAQNYKSEADARKGLDSTLRNCAAKAHLKVDAKNTVKCVALNNKELVASTPFADAAAAKAGRDGIQAATHQILKEYVKSIGVKNGPAPSESSEAAGSSSSSAKPAKGVKGTKTQKLAPAKK